jgi:hypothetical protein
MIRLFVPFGIVGVLLVAFLATYAMAPEFQMTPTVSLLEEFQAKGVTPDPNAVVENEEVEHSIFDVPEEDRARMAAAQQAMGSMEGTAGIEGMSGMQMDGDAMKPEGEAAMQMDGDAMKPEGEATMQMDGDAMKPEGETAMQMDGGEMKPHAETTMQMDGDAAEKPHAETAMQMDGDAMKPEGEAAMQMDGGEMKPHAETTMQMDGGEIEPHADEPGEQAHAEEAEGHAGGAGLAIAEEGPFDREINLTMTEWGYSDINIEVKKGERIRFNITNGGKIPHEFMFMTMPAMTAVGYRAQRAD